LLPRWFGPLCVESLDLSVGSEKPPPLPLERCAKVPRTEAESWRDSVAHPSKVSPWFGECGQGNVLCEHVTGSALTDDPCHLGPQVSRVGDAKALSCGAPRLAREPAANNVDLAAPGSSVERAHVLEDRERRQDALELPGLEHLAAVRLEFDSAHRDMAEQDAAQDPAADSGEEVKLAHHASPSSSSPPITPQRLNT